MTWSGTSDDRGVIGAALPKVTLELPAKTEDLDLGRACPALEDRVRPGVELSRLNVESGAAGAFGAAVFDPSTNRAVGAGVNLVVRRAARWRTRSW